MSQNTPHKAETLSSEKNSEGIQAVQESTNELQALTETIDSSIHEKIGENIPDQKIPGKSQKQTSFFDIRSISDRIKGLIPSGSKTKKTITLPKKEIQVKLVEKSLKAKQKQLLSQAGKIVGSKKFSAAKLESIVNQIRYIQSLLEELVHAAAKTVEKLYRKFVLKTG